MRCNSRLNSILFTALNNLSNRSLIDYQIQTMIVVPSTDKKNTLSRHYVADDDEIRRILAVEHLENLNQRTLIFIFNLNWTDILQADRLSNVAGHIQINHGLKDSFAGL